MAKEQKRFLHSTAFKDKDLQRELSFYTVPTMSILSPEKYLEFKKILLDMEYLTSNFTRHETNDLAVWANWWREYYDKKSTPKRSNYKRYLELKREAANLHGLESPWHAWLNKYGGASFDDQLDAMIPQFMPLYEQLHAYTRFKLRIKYGETVVPEKGLIPLHIVGHLEGPHFLGIKDLLQPYPDYNDDGEVLKAMMRRNYTSRSLYERADEFFHSLNFSKVPDQFWNNSILERPTDGRNMFCGAPSSWSFEVTDDVRTIHCSDLSKVNLNIAHHEMGHIQYYLQSQHLPVVFHSAANQAIGEAVGDTIYLSASRPKHLARIGLLRSDLNDEKVKINHLMEMALDKIVGLFSCYATDQYRKELFLQTTTVEDNCRYWQLRDKYGGVEPPVERSNADFDVAVSQHVSADRDYLKYIVGFITQFQFHKGLCETAGEYVTGDPEKTLNNCDIYGSVAAGKILKKMMSMGASKPWPDVMEVITGQRNIDAGPMLEYFRPLHEWLEKMNRRNKAFVGWTSSKSKFKVWIVKMD